jgi:predicted secreted protein
MYFSIKRVEVTKKYNFKIEKRKLMNKLITDLIADYLENAFHKNVF